MVLDCDGVDGVCVWIFFGEGLLCCGEVVVV